MDSIIGSIIFEFIGASIKWLFYAIIHLFKGEKVISFGTIYSGDPDDEFHDKIFGGIYNILVGLLVTVGIIVLLIRFGL